MSDAAVSVKLGHWEDARAFLDAQRKAGYAGIPPRIAADPHGVIQKVLEREGYLLGSSVWFGLEYSPAIYCTGIPSQPRERAGVVCGALDDHPSLRELRALAIALKKGCRCDEASVAVTVNADGPAGQWSLRVRLWWD